MNWKAEILSVISEYYPSREEYTIERYPYNDSCVRLKKKCENAKTDNQWAIFLSSAREHIKASTIDDNTMLMYCEPSYQCSIIFEVDSACKRIEYIVSISVLVNCFYIFRRVYESDVSEPDKYYITGYDYNLSQSNSDEFYQQIKEIVKVFFSNFYELPYFIALHKVPKIVVPNRYDARPSIFNCVFNLRM